MNFPFGGKQPIFRCENVSFREGSCVFTFFADPLGQIMQSEEVLRFLFQGILPLEPLPPWHGMCQQETPMQNSNKKINT